MRDYTSTYIIDKIDILLEKSVFSNSTEWYNYIQENKGSFYKRDQCMTFTSNGFEIVVEFEFLVSADYISDSGDYFTPPTSSTCIDRVDIFINSVTIDDYNVELNDDVVGMFKKFVDNNL